MNWISSWARRSVGALVLGGLAAAAAPLAAQQANTVVRGKVVEAVTRRPVSSVTIGLAGTEIRTQTGEDGSFTLQGQIRPGSYRLTLARIGYARQVRDLTIGEDRTVDIGEVQMQPVSVQLSEVVVTGTGAPSEKRELGNTVTSVQGDQVN